MSLPPDLIDRLAEFGAEGVDYLLIGGHAVALPGRLVVWVPGGDFELSFNRRVTLKIGNVAVNLIGIDELIEIKEASGRPQDLEDAAVLRAARDTKA